MAAPIKPLRLINIFQKGLRIQLQMRVFPDVKVNRSPYLIGPFDTGTYGIALSSSFTESFFNRPRKNITKRIADALHTANHDVSIIFKSSEPVTQELSWGNSERTEHQAYPITVQVLNYKYPPTLYDAPENGEPRCTAKEAIAKWRQARQLTDFDVEDQMVMAVAKDLQSGELKDREPTSSWIPMIIPFEIF